MSESYCSQLVRKYDPDRFLISLYFEPEIREHLWALYAFNYEIAKTREVVTDTHIGLIRLQWWRDIISGFYEKNSVAKNEVAEALANAIWRFELPRGLFDNMIYAREFDLEDQTPGSLEGLCNYADFTHTPLLQLGTIVTGGNNDHPALQPVAMAYSLTGLIRAVPFHTEQGRRYIPENLNPADVREQAEALLRQAPRECEGRLIRLHRMVSQQYLRKIRGLKDNPYHPAMAIAPIFRSLGLAISLRKR
jgi:NADH dehydrogenase [ubiquinone] 1 alpha subcomplex assembly factor 6